MLKLYNAIMITLSFSMLVHLTLEDNNAVPVLSSPASIIQYLNTQDASLENIQLLQLVEMVYYEGRDEPFQGKIAIAWVAKNRLAKGDYGLSYIDVINDPGQFSYNDTRKPPVKDEEEWKRAVKAAKIVFMNEIEDPTQGAIYYRNKNVKISNQSIKFFTKLKQTVTIGKHTFYKEK